MTDVTRAATTALHVGSPTKVVALTAFPGEQPLARVRRRLRGR